MKHARGPHHRPGFTLIELLVVVAIIALLISILLPSLNRARELTKRTVCATRLKDIGISIASYEVEFNRLPRQVLDLNGEAFGFFPYSVHEWLAEAMGGLRKDRDSLVDPSSDERLDLTQTHQVFYCVLVPPEETTNSGVLSGGNSNLDLGELEGTAADDYYIHISYNYYGRLDEAANDPAKNPTVGNSDLETDVLQKRRNYAGKIPKPEDVLMSDSVAAWVGAAPPQWRVNHKVGWGPEIDMQGPFAPGFVGANQLFAGGAVEWRTADAHFPEASGEATVRDALRAYTMRGGGNYFWW